MTAPLDLSVVVPVFNAADRLPALVEAIRETLGALALRGEVILVDDGSLDESWEVILDLQARYGACVRGYRLGRNFGQQAATYCGLLEAAGTWVATIDDDMQPHPREIAKLWAHARGDRTDVIYGTYRTRRQGPARRFGALVFWALLRRVAPGFPDGSSFRLVRGELLQSIPRHPGPSVLVDAVLAWQTAGITSVVVEHGPRRSGRSGYALADLGRIALMLLFTYSRLPLRVMTGTGLLSAAVSFALGLYFLHQKITVGAQLGFSALIVTITFSAGLILLSLGILGEYISRIHAMGSGEPAFTIKARALG